MKVPTIGHMEYAVLNAMPRGLAVPGHFIRNYMDANGIRFSGPKFYQLMGRLERRKLVIGHYRSRIIYKHGRRRERWYRITREGFTAMDIAFQFYTK